MRDNDILIRQIIFDLEIESEEAFQSYADIIKKFTRNNILNILSELENDESFSNIDIHIDQLIIDLDLIDILSLENLESFFKSKILEEIRIRSSIQKHQNYPHTVKFTIEQLLKFFSDYGFLPWSFNTKKKVNSLFNTTISNSSQPQLINKLLLKDQRSFNRIVEILTTKNRISLFKLILKNDYKLFKQLVIFYRNIISEVELAVSIQNSNQVQFHILGLFNKYSNQNEKILTESVSYLQKTHAIKLNEIINHKEYQTINLQRDTDYKNIQVSNLIKIFVDIEQKKFLEVLFSEVNQDKNLVNIFPVSNKKIGFGIALQQIIEAYHKKHHYTTQEVVLKLISYLKQKSKLLKFESLTLSLLGVELINNPYFKGIINESVFLDVINTLGMAMSWNYIDVIDNVQILLSVQKQAQYNNLIKLTAFEYIQQQKSSINEIDFFKSILKVLVSNDSSALPINSRLLDSQGIARLYSYIDQSEQVENLSVFRNKAELSIDDILDFHLQSIKDDQRILYHNQVKTLISSLFKQQIHTLSLTDKTSLIKEATQIIVKFSKNQQLDISAREIEFVKNKTLQLVEQFIDHQKYSLAISDKIAQKKIVLQFLEKILNNDITSKSKGGAEIIKKETVRILENLFSGLIKTKIKNKEKAVEADSNLELDTIDDLLNIHIQSIEKGDRVFYNKQVKIFISSLFKQQIQTLSLTEKTSIIKEATQIIVQFSYNQIQKISVSEKDFVVKKTMQLVEQFIDHQKYSLAISDKNAQKKIVLQFLEKLLNNDITSKSKGGAEIIKKETVKILQNLFSRLAYAKLSSKERIGEADSDVKPDLIDDTNIFNVNVDQNINDLLDFHLQSIEKGDRVFYNKQVKIFIRSLFEQQIDTLSSTEKASIIKKASQIILQYSENQTQGVTTTEKGFVLKKVMKLVELFLDHQVQSIAVLERNTLKKNIYQFLQQLLDKEISSKSKAGSELIKKQIVKILESLFYELAKEKTTAEKKIIQDKLIQKKEYNLDTKYFDYILNLNNEIGLDNGTEKSKNQTTFISLDDILKNSKNLFDFIKTYSFENELIEYFSNITLKSDINEKFTQLVEKKFKLWIELENKLITIQNSIHFSDLDISKFKKVLRYFLIKTLGDVDSPEDLILGEFTYYFLQFLEIDSNIQLSKIKNFVELKFSEDILEGFDTMVDVNQFSLLPENKRTWLYFRDLYYFYLKTNTVPDWGNIQMIDYEEIINFISLLIKKNDQVFLNKIFSDDVIVKNIFKLLDDESTQVLYKLLGVLKPESQKHDLTTIIKEFISSIASQMNRSTFYVLECVFFLKLWKSNSVVFVNEQLHKIISSDKIVAGFKISNKRPINPEIEKLLQYYVDSKSVLEVLKVKRIKIHQLIISYLLSNPNVAISYVEQVIDDLKFGNPLTDVFTVKVLQESLLFYFSQYPIELSYLKAFFKELEKKKKKELSFEVLNTLFSFFVIQKTEKTYLPVVLLELIESQFTSKSKLYKNIINTIKQDESDLTIDRLEYDFSALKQKNNFNSLKHYIEFGSARVEDFNYSIGDYKLILKNQSILSIKKYAHNWSKNEQKLNRLLSFYTTTKEREILLDLIHSKIRVFLNELFSIFDTSNFSKTDLYIQQFPSQDQVKLILMIWGKRNFKVDNPYEFLRNVIQNFLTTNKISEEVLISHFSEVNWSRIKLLSKRKLTQAFIKPLPKLVKPNIELSNVNKLNEELKSGISIHNAGLVITWPFLNTLFSKMGLTEGQKFKDDLSVQKAIIATQYLVNDSQEYEESELILNKILCGVDIDFYVDTSIKLVDVEIAVCNMALKTIVQQWDKMKSVDALRDYFLKREGVLKINDSGYELHIEKQTTDILLRFLPWNLSIIKSSIMKLKLIIDWKYI